MDANAVSVCKLCDHRTPEFVSSDKRRPFYLCGNCGLVTVPEKYWLSVDDERARYDLHDNGASNDGYVKYLSQAADVIMSDCNCHPDIKVLDFGSGKDAVLCGLLTERGVNCLAYDPLYKRELPDAGKFDVIILCEVIEHVRDIKKELALVDTLLDDSGVVVIRTQLYKEPSVFPNWWYAQDLTHINFWSERSLGVAAAILGKRMERTTYQDIFVLQ